MKTTALHFSDTHGKPIQAIKGQDLIIHSGDAADNDVNNFTPGYWEGKKFIPTSWQRGAWDFRLIDRKKEAIQQKVWWEKQLEQLTKKGYGPEDIIYVPGNHCFYDAQELLPNSCWWEPKTIIVKGIKFGLLPGINGVGLCGEWNQEITEYELNEMILKIDRDIQVLISHTPAYGVGDCNYGGMHIGSQPLTTAIFGTPFKTGEPYFTHLEAHLYGHAHESRGVIKHTIRDRVIKFSNAAQGRHLINFEGGE